MELQRHLIALGHLEGDVDGIIGSGTLEGVRSYQRAKKLQVDGYPTQTILTKLRAEAPAAPAMVPQSTPSIPAPQAVPAQAVPAQAVPAPAVPAQAAVPQALAPQAPMPQAAPQLLAPAQPLPQGVAPPVYPQQAHPLQTLPWDSWHTGGISTRSRSAADAPPPAN